MRCRDVPQSVHEWKSVNGNLSKNKDQLYSRINKETVIITMRRRVYPHCTVSWTTPSNVAIYWLTMNMHATDI